MNEEKVLEHLPIGSVVLLKGATQKTMIIGHGRWDANNQLWDYDIGSYPEGIMPGTAAIHNYDIGKVFSIGYFDEEAKNINQQIKEIHENNPNKTGKLINHLKDLVVDENGYIPKVGERPNKYLPIGTVVSIKRSPEQKLLIIGHGITDEDSSEKYDYVCCVYPYGCDLDQLGLINEEDIDKVYYVGYYDKEQEEYMDYVDKRIDEVKELEQKREPRPAGVVPPDGRLNSVETVMTRNENHGKQPKQEAPKSKKTSVLAGCAASVIIIGIMLVVFLSPRELVINDRSPIEMYAGESITLVAYDREFNPAYSEVVEWEIDNEKVLTIEGDTLYARYDSASFDDIADEYDQAKEGTPCCRTKIHAKIKDGWHSWEGTQDVYIYQREE